MTDEEKAEERYCKTCKKKNNCFHNCDVFIEYTKGLAEGRKEQWHDLRKDPNDLPEKCVEVLVLYSNTYGNGGYIVNKHTLMYELAQYIDDEEDTSECYWVETGTDYDIHKVIAWCELPKFEE